jgi:hypothetical protein
MAGGPTERVVRADEDVVDRLVAMPGADLTTLLLEVMRRRVAALTPASVLRAYGQNRFTAPAQVAWEALRGVEAAALAAYPGAFTRLELSPMAVLGSNAALAPVDQRKVVSALRGGEVLADPTTALALEAAVRRRAALGAAPRSAEAVRLVTATRVVRAQHVDAPGLFAHFRLVGAVTAGRDTGHLAFERAAAVEHLGAAARACLATGADAVRLDLTDLTGGAMRPVLDAVREGLADLPQVAVADWPERAEGRSYYDGFCAKVHATYGGAAFEVGDGGLVDWTQQLLADRKERLFTSGLGLERIAAAAPPLRSEGWS